MLECVKVLKDHHARCDALKSVGDGTWHNPWSQAPIETAWGNNAGPGKGSNTLWWIVPCLDPECDGKLGIRGHQALEVLTD